MPEPSLADLINALGKPPWRYVIANLPGLPYQVRNALAGHRFALVLSDLVALSDDEIRDTPGVGPEGLAALKTGVAALPERTDTDA